MPGPHAALESDVDPLTSQTLGQENAQQSPLPLKDSLSEQAALIRHRTSFPPPPSLEVVLEGCAFQGYGALFTIF